MVWLVCTLLIVVASVQASRPGNAVVTELAVTVDDLPAHGPLPAGTTRLGVVERMIEAFRRHGVRSVYGFVNGEQLERDRSHDDTLRAWQRAGFRVGNHTFSHLDLSHVTAAEYIADIERNEPIVARFDGGPRYFRYAYLHEGNTVDKRNAVRHWLLAHGYTIAQVTVDFDDWAWNHTYARCVARRDAEAVIGLRRSFLEAATSRLLASKRLSDQLYGRQIRHILLIHAGPFTALVLDELLAAYRNAGVTFIGLEAAATDPAYAVDPRIVSHGERTFLEQIAESRMVRMPAQMTGPPAPLTQICR
jgi:peptidoglycan/xylan/chitin deacetylase (PgdA/CDA1 family)